MLEFPVCTIGGTEAELITMKLEFDIWIVKDGRMSSS